MTLKRGWIATPVTVFCLDYRGGHRYNPVSDSRKKSLETTVGSAGGPEQAACLPGSHFNLGR